MLKLKRFLLMTVILSIMLSTVFRAVPSNKENKVESIFLSESNVEFMAIGETRTVKATVLPTSTINQTVSWSSSDPTIATCENGVITAVGYGACIVRANCDGITSVCTIKVHNLNPKVSILQKEIVITNLEASKQLTALTYDKENITSSVRWYSSNTSIATCVNGLVEANNYGVCKITAISSTGDFDVCTVIVQNPNEPTLMLSKNELYLKLNDSHTLIANKTQNAGENITWISSNEEIAVCENGTVKAVSDGVCAIIAITENGVSDCCVVSAGAYNIPTTPKQIVNFSIPEIPVKLKCVDKFTGKISSISVATSYNLDHFIDDNGKLRMIIEINYVKIYDINGASGTSPVVVTTQLFKEMGLAALNKETKKYTGLKVGDSFTVPVRQFYVGNPVNNQPRELYIAFDQYIEL